MDEEIDTYWNSLDEHDRNWSLGEESHFRNFTSADLSGFGVTKGYNFSMMADTSFTNLQASKSGNKTL